MSQETPDYFQRRAEEEQAAADQAATEPAAQSHRALAEHYRKIADGEEEPKGDKAEALDGANLRQGFCILP